jgi:WD40 repeat protein
LAGGAWQKIKIWDTIEFEQISELIGHKGYIWSVKFNPDGKLLASGSADHSIILWNVVL